MTRRVGGSRGGAADAAAAGQVGGGGGPTGKAAESALEVPQWAVRFAAIPCFFSALMCKRDV